MKTFNYLLILDKTAAPGVYGKVTGTINAFTRKGMQAKLTLVPPNGIRGYISLLYFMFSDNSDILLVRFNSKISIFYPLLSIFRRLRNRSTVCDMPTPLVNVKQELLVVQNSRYKICMYRFLYVFVYPITFTAFDLILEYAHESKWISLLSRKNRFLISNSVEIDMDRKQKFRELKNCFQLNFIAVGTIAPWHGWDKFLHGLAKYKANFADYKKFHLTIIGDGPDRSLLEKIVSDDDLSSIVSFEGHIPFENIAEYYQDRHIGVGSLGWERVGVTVASPIKSREYLANGLNVIYATQDLDLNKCKSAYQLSHGCKVDEIYNYLINIEDIYKYAPKECFEFAETYCSFDALCERLICRLGS